MKAIIFVLTEAHMRILFINSLRKNRWGGGEKWMIEAASGLNEKGHHCIIGCLDHSIIQEKAKFREIKTVKFSIKSDLDIYAMYKLENILKRLKIDVLVCCQNKDVKIGGRAARKAHTSAVFSRQGLQLFKNKKRYRFPFTQLVDGIITNTQSIKTIYESFGWFKPDFIHVIYNGMQMPPINEMLDKRDVFGVKQDTKVVLSAGRLSSQKGFEYLIEAAKKCKDAQRNYMFFIAGTGKLETSLKEQIQELKLEDTVKLLGFKQDMIPYYQTADVFVLPSLFEGMPNVVMESMANGTPTILTRVNGAEELVEDSVHGFIIEPQNPQMITDSLDRYFDKATDREQMARNARERIEEHFTTAAMSDKLEALFLDQLKNTKQ